MNRFGIRKPWQLMPQAVLWIGAATCIRCLAQPAFSPDAPLLPPSSITPAVTPPSPAISNPAIAASVTASTNLSLSGLAQLLAGLRAQLQETLPVLNAFNSSFDFISVGSVTNMKGISGTGANFSSSSGANLSSNTGANLASTVAVPTFNTQSGLSLNAFGLPPGLGVAPITSETLRALLVLESDIERMLPTINALTGGSNVVAGIGLTPGFIPGAVTNVFMVPSVVR